MATRRDILPGKEKKTIPSPSPVHSTKTSTSGSPSPAHPRLPRSATTDVAKNLVKKPSSSRSPAPDRSKLPKRKSAPSVSSLTQKTTPQKSTRASTNPLPRSSSLPVLKAAAASTKPAQDKDKNVKPQVKDAGKNRPARPVGTVRKVRADVKKQGTQNTILAANTKKQGSQHTTSATNGRLVSSLPHKKVKHSDESEVKCRDEDIFLAEFDDLTVEDLRSHNEHEFSESFSYEQSEDENDSQIETAEFSKVLEHPHDPIGMETKVYKDEPCIEDVRQEQHEMEDAVDEVKSVGYNADRENNEEVEEEEEMVLNIKEAAARGREAHDFQETDEHQEVEEKKKEIENAVPKQQIVLEKEQKSKDASEDKIVEEKEHKSEKVHPEEQIVQEKKQELENKPPNQGIAVENKQESENESHKKEVFEFKKQDIENAPDKQAFVEKKQEPENNAQRLQVQGKKGGSPVSNDVIEETAIKFREQRKNKVKALAQAFESVMALQ